jgi:S1-C subfamily serine protease
LLLGACQSTASPFPQGVASTPLAVLPVAITSVQSSIPPTPLPLEFVTQADAEYLLLANLYARVTPSVVNVEAVRVVVDSLRDASRGSGWVYDKQGYIVTNAHVVKDAVDVRVTFNDGAVVAASLVGLDVYSDLAVLRVNVAAERLFPLTLADSNGVRVGQRAITIGNPFGLSSSMTMGIISGLGRTLLSGEMIDSQALGGYQNPSIIQTDTPINVGNSGAPLLNSFGDVVGVTTAIRTDTGVFQGVGFAVPSNTVARVVPQLVDKGRVDYPYLGISVNPEANGYTLAGIADALNLPVKQGVLVRGVAENSPATVAGLRGGNRIATVRGRAVCVGGDIIVAVNERYVANMDDLTAYLIANASVGDVVTLRIVRDKATFDVPVLLTARPTQAASVRDCAG